MSGPCTHLRVNASCLWLTIFGPLSGALLHHVLLGGASRLRCHATAGRCARLVVDLGGAQRDAEDVLVIAILILHAIILMFL